MRDTPPQAPPPAPLPGVSVPAEEFDPRAPGFIADPYPAYARLRARDPLPFVEATGDWWALRHADCVRVLSEECFVKGPRTEPELPPAFAHLPRLGASMLASDPPDHTRLRALVNRAFTPRVVEHLRPRIQAIADTLLDAITAGGPRTTTPGSSAEVGSEAGSPPGAKAASDPGAEAGADVGSDAGLALELMEGFAFPLPAIVIAEMLGVPPADRERFQAWSRRVVQLLDGTQPEEARRDGWRAHLELLDYFDRLIRERRHGGRGNLIAELVAAEEAGDRLSAGEVLRMCSLLLTAGHETTTHLIGVGTLTLLQHPAQWRLLREHPELAPNAVEELLRFSPPVQIDGRVAAVDVELGGRRIAAGQWVLTIIGAANRDPEVFAHPERLDLTRTRNPHLAFGRGIHFCLGAPLARLEAHIAFTALSRRLPGLRLDATAMPQWGTNTVIRGLRSLPLRF